MKQAIPVVVTSVTSFLSSIFAVGMKNVSRFLLRCDIPCT